MAGDIASVHKHTADELRALRDILTRENNNITRECGTLIHERDTLAYERNNLIHEHDGLIYGRDDELVSVENFIPETLILEEVSAPAAIPMRSL
ncbi:hypothetical protein GTA08_BOTSDO08292 [Botryosphaeria dothidea]|uniref:Uncharacterized protein n=1 Tax=Botryosphaeria dothidea TaxID=55169 RepID=A0A8H4IPV0_9PEZI|nr:hypothetical protein GTA08_BOTSDO08292 [Botryosphaeria dothidea]